MSSIDVGVMEGSRSTTGRGGWRKARALFAVLALCAAAVAVALAVFWLHGASTSARIHLPERVKLDCVAVDRHQATEAPPLVSAWVFKDAASNGTVIIRGRANMSATSHTQRQVLTVFDDHAWVQEYWSVVNGDEDDAGAADSAGGEADERMVWGFPKCADATRLPLTAELEQLLSTLTLADTQTTSGAAMQFGWTCSHGETALVVNSGKKPTLVCVDAEWTHMDVVTSDFHASCAVDTSATLSSIPEVAAAAPALGCGSNSPPNRRRLDTCSLSTELKALHLSEDVLLRYSMTWDGVARFMGANWDGARSKIESMGATLRRGSDPTLVDVACSRDAVQEKLWSATLDTCWPGPPSATELFRMGSWDDVQLSLGDNFTSFIDTCVAPQDTIRQGKDPSLQDIPLKKLFFWMNLWEDTTLQDLLASQSLSVVQLLAMDHNELAASNLDVHTGAEELVGSLDTITGSDYPHNLKESLQATWKDGTSGKRLAKAWLRWRVVSEVTAASTVAFVDFMNQPHGATLQASALRDAASNSTAFDIFSTTMTAYGSRNTAMHKLFRSDKIPGKWPLFHTRTKLRTLRVNPATVASASKWGDLSEDTLTKLDEYLQEKGSERQPDEGVELKDVARRMCFTHIASKKWSKQIHRQANPPALLPEDFPDTSSWPNKFSRKGLGGLLQKVKEYAGNHSSSGPYVSCDTAKDYLPSWLVIDEVTNRTVAMHIGDDWNVMQQDHPTEFDAVVAKLAENGAEPELERSGIYPVCLIQKLNNGHCQGGRRLDSTRVLQTVANMTKLKVAPNASDIPRRRRRGFDAESSSSTTSVRGSACLTFTLSGGTTPAGDGACASHNVVQLVTAATAGLAPLAAAPRHPFDDANVSAATSYSYLYGAHGDDNPSRVVKAAILHRVCAAVDSLVYTGDPNAPPLIVFAHGVANVWLAEALRLNACSLGTGGVWIEMQPAGDRGLRDLGAWGESWCHSLDGAKFTSADDVGMNILGRFCGLIPAEYPARAWATPRQVWLDLMSVRCCGLGVASACHDRAQCLTTCGDVAQAHQFVPASLTQFIRERVNATICSTRSDPTAGATPDTSFDLGLRFPGPTAQAGEASPTWSWCWASQAELEAHGYDWSARLEDRCVVLWHVVPWLCVTRGLRVTSRLSCCLWVQEQVLPRQRHFL